MEHGQDDIGGEGTADGDLVFQMVLAFEDFGKADVLVHWFEPFLDVLVLVLVEVLEFFRLGGFFVEDDGAVAIAFSGGVSSDEVDLALGLQLA